MIEKLYTVEEVADLASVTGRTIRNYLKSGRLIGRKIGGQWRFPENEVQRLLTGGPRELDIGDEPKRVYNDVDPYTSENELIPDEQFSYDQHRLSAPAIETAHPAQEQPLLNEKPVPPPAPQPSQQDHSSSTEAQYSTHPAPASLPNGAPAAHNQEPPAMPPPPPQYPPQYAQQGYPNPAMQPYGYPGCPQTPMQQQPSMPNGAYSQQNMMYGVPQQPSPFAPQQQQRTAYEQPLVPQYTAQGYTPVGPVHVPLYSPAPSYMYTAGAGGPMPTLVPPPQPIVEQPAAAETEKPKQKKKAVAPFAELSDVGRRVAQFVSEVHDCSDGPQICTVVDLHQSLASAKITSERLSDIARQETERGPTCLAFVEFDARYYIARYTLFGTSTYISRSLILLG